MIEVYLRPFYQTYLINPIARRIPFTPQSITLSACLTGISVAPVLIFHFSILAIVLLLISGLLDMLDGSVGRMKNSISNLGSALDIISDRIVEFAVIMGLFLVAPAEHALGALLMLGSCYLCITCFLVVGIFTPNHSEKGFHYNPGLIERAEVFVFFIVMIIWPQYFSWLAGLFTVLVLLTGYLHIKQYVVFDRAE